MKLAARIVSTFIFILVLARVPRPRAGNIHRRRASSARTDSKPSGPSE